VVRLLLRAAEHGLAIIGLGFLVYHLCFDLSVMVSGSMEPALRGESREDGEWVLTEKVSYWFRRPRRWEVVTFRSDEANQRMKRVVGLPGERTSLVEGQVAIDGGVIERPASLAYLNYCAYGDLRGGRQADCGDGYYVLGDDSEDSQDSRYEGPLCGDAVVGRAWLVIWPPSRVRFVGP
jgi:signal peptidase I